MKWISFNYRGLANLAKKLALKGLLDSELIHITYLQETLGMVKKIISIMHSLNPGWTFHALNIKGRTGGITIGIDPRTIRIISSSGVLVLWHGHLLIGAGYGFQN